MEAIQTHDDLQKAIHELENRQMEQKNAMEQHFHESYESIKPVNIIKNTLHDINDSEEVKKAMVKAAVGLAIGYVTKLLIDSFVLKTKRPVTSRIGTLIQFLISGWVAKNGEMMKNIALHFFKRILNKRLQHQKLSIGS